jgi:hypothetical protein
MGGGSESLIIGTLTARDAESSSPTTSPLTREC